MCNTNGTMHGGAVATFADFASSLPIVAIWQDDRWPYSLGVSTNINVRQTETCNFGIGRITCYAPLICTC
jgi:acyl-coenzyme A thioesterase PaaI-like protein